MCGSCVAAFSFLDRRPIVSQIYIIWSDICFVCEGGLVVALGGALAARPPHGMACCWRGAGAHVDVLSLPGDGVVGNALVSPLEDHVPAVVSEKVNSYKSYHHFHLEKLIKQLKCVPALRSHYTCERNFRMTQSGQRGIAVL